MQSSGRTTDPDFEGPESQSFPVVTRLEDPPPWVQRNQRRAERWNAWRRRFIEHEKKQRPRRWVFASEIADWESRPAGTLISKKEDWPRVYDTLSRALRAGEFELDGRVAVRWLPRSYWPLRYLGRPRLRMSRSRFTALARLYKTKNADGSERSGLDNPMFTREVVKRLVLPADAYRRWRRDHGVVSPLPMALEVEEWPRVSDQALRTWYAARVRKCQAGGEEPTRKEDWQAATADLRFVSQDRVYAIRKQLAPSSWTARGRRTGRIKK